MRVNFIVKLYYPTIFYLEHLKKYVKEMKELSYENQKEYADNEEIFFHILGCCLLCCEDLIHNKGTKIGEEAHMYCCIEGDIMHDWFIQDENAHIKITCKRISDKIYNSFMMKALLNPRFNYNN